MADQGAEGHGGTQEGRPQLGMWDDGAKETVIGALDHEGERWKVLVIVEPISADLVRGSLSFRLADTRYDTAPVLLEDTVSSVVRRAAGLPETMLKQLLASARR